MRRTSAGAKGREAAAILGLSSGNNYKRRGPISKPPESYRASTCGTKSEGCHINHSDHNLRETLVAQELFSYSRPSPVEDALTETYWRGAADGELLIQRCTQCTRYQHPPTAICFTCGTITLVPVPVTGRGRIYSCTVVHTTREVYFQSRVPYTIAMIELDEQPALIVCANLPADPVSDIAIGVPVEFFTEATAGSGDVLPQFRIVRTASSVEGVR
jgi:uncharacterized OB-fold protein